MTEFLGAQQGWATHKRISKRRISHYQIGSANKPEPCRNSVTFGIKNTAEQINFRSWVPSAGSFVNPDVRMCVCVWGGSLCIPPQMRRYTCLLCSPWKMGQQREQGERIMSVHQVPSVQLNKST